MKIFMRILTGISATFITAFTILLLFLMCANLTYGQTIKLAPTPPAAMFGIASLNANVQSGPVWDLRGTGINYHKFQWSTIGTVSAGACKLQGSATFNMASPSDIIAAQTVTSNGGPTTITSGAGANYIQITCSTPITGTGSVVVYYTGYNDAPISVAAPGANVTLTFAASAYADTVGNTSFYISDAAGHQPTTPSFLYGFNGTSWDRIRATGPTGSLNTIATPGVTTADALTSVISASVTNSVNVKASAGNVYGFSIANGAATVCYAQFINSAGAGTLGTAVIFAIALPGSSTVNFPPGGMALSNFSTGIAVGLATTPNTNSACGTAGNVTTFFK